MPLKVETVRAALEQHAAVALEDDTMKEYLESLLQDEDAYEDLEGLTESVMQFLEDDRQVADNLVKAISSTFQTAAPTKPKTTPAAVAPTKVVEDHHDDTESSHSASSQHDEAAEPTSPKSRAEARKAKRMQKRAQKQKQKKSQGKKTTATATTSGSEDIHDVVARINATSAAELNEMDDYASAWDQVKAGEQGASSKKEVVWGGRGFGGRGVNRGLGVYKGKDAVVQNMTLSYGGKDLLQETHLAISYGHRYGLMGANGVGKSTLLKRIASGSVPGWPLHLSVQMVEQEVLGSNLTVLESMKQIQEGGSGIERSSSKRKQALLEEHAALEAVLEDANADPEATEAAAERLSEIYDQLEALDNQQSSDDEEEAQQEGWTGVDPRAKTILRGLQFKASMLHTPGNHLSGGWRMRVALAQALYSEPDVLLLDEPTNHLDLSAILFLEGWIVDEELTVVVVSHDGPFLDAVCTDMIKFEGGKLKYHVGNYSSFRESEEQMWARNTRKAEAAAKKEKKAMEFINKQKSMANSKHRDDNKQKQAAERQKKLGRIGLFSENGQKFKLLAEGNTKKGGSNRAGHIFGNYTNARGMQSAFVSNEQVAFGEDRQLLNFKFPAAPPLKGGANQPLITMEDGRFRYGQKDPWLLQDMSLNVSYGSRIAIVGKNGAGKSTLLKLLCGEMEVNSGEFHRHANLKTAHIAQHHIEHLGSFLESTPVEYFLRQHHAKNEQEARQYLGGFGLVGSLALQQIGTLSGGQKARLAFATVMYTEPHLLVLDEPTNHLDRDSLESLAMAVDKFEGGVVIVSHNQDFMSRCAKEMWTVKDGHVKVEVADGEATTFDDLFENYKESLRKELKKK